MIARKSLALVTSTLTARFVIFRSMVSRSLFAAGLVWKDARVAYVLVVGETMMGDQVKLQLFLSRQDLIQQCPS
jgi:hypothetical protein